MKKKRSSLTTMVPVPPPPLLQLPPLLLLLLLIATTLLPDQLHASKPNSLVLGLTHSRILSPGSSVNPMEATDVVEALRGYRDGYIISLNLGTPPQLIQAYLDTGSDLTWVPCGNTSFECVDCDDYRDHKLVSAFSPTSSSSATRDLCASPLCVDVHSSDNSYDPCAMAGCSIAALLSGGCPRPCPSFSYTYGAGGLVVGTLARDTLRVRGSAATREVSDFGFGCVRSTFREPVGIAGFGKGVLSLPSQLGFLRKGFSHCFLAFKYVNNPNVSSPLVIGSLAISSTDQFIFTPMLKNPPLYPNYYYVGLEGISIADEKTTLITIDAPLSLRAFDSAGNGGMLIDSGTTYTHLPEPFFSLLIAKLDSTVSYARSSEFERRTGFGLCYEIPCSKVPCADDLPSVSLHLVDGVKLPLPKENCFYAMSPPRGSKVVKCLLFQVMDEVGYGPAGVFGSFQQQNMEVVYDLQGERVGFQPMDCAASAATYGLNTRS